MQTRNEVIQNAHYKAIFIIKRDPLGNPANLLNELEHFFNKDMQEIACIFDPFGLEIIQEFNPPRIWHESFFPAYVITKLKGNKSHGNSCME